MHRASYFGAGNKDIPANSLLVAYRCTNLSIPIFCSHVILSAISQLNQNTKSLPSMVWRSFILGRVSDNTPLDHTRLNHLTAPRHLAEVLRVSRYGPQHGHS